MLSQSDRKTLKRLAIVLAILVTLVGAPYALYRYLYPYGYKHACLMMLGMSLNRYAECHDGHFPKGGNSPEASLSLLYREHYEDAYILSGKTKSAEVAERILQGGGLLDPETCDWHYVEGLTLCDDPRLAIIWDKVGLNHVAGRLAHGGHSIWRLSRNYLRNATVK
jgi:hypothetical protein